VRAWIPALPFFVEVVQVVGPDKRDQPAAIGHATMTTDTDDIIREELARRAKYDEQYRAKVNRVVRPLGSHTRIPRSVQMELDEIALAVTRE
jgi:hypothetical protein